MLKTFNRLYNLTAAQPANTWFEVLNTATLPTLSPGQPHSIFLTDFRVDAYLTSTLTLFSYTPTEGQSEQEQLFAYLTALRSQEQLATGSLTLELGKSLDGTTNYLRESRTAFVNPGYPTTQDLISAVTSGTEDYLEFGARLAIRLSRQLTGSDILVIDLKGTIEAPVKNESVVVYSP